ncbi:hypothetical protein GC177_09750 [bacterium]|nr:hypothetical protein [bacterium]
MHGIDGTAEAIILVKASPQISSKYGETVCCAGITLSGEWVRLYPVTFRKLEDVQQFGRWDLIRFRWRKPKNDPRPESLHVDQQSIEVVGEIPKSERQSLLAKFEVSGIDKVAADGKSLALLRPQNPKFIIERKTSDEVDRERAGYSAILKQQDLFYKGDISPLEPCPYRFKYRYQTNDGERFGTCQDWETDATFFHWKKRYGEEQTLEQMQRVFGEEFPKKGMVFAMGTHSLYPDTWLINGIIRMDEIIQMSLF